MTALFWLLVFVVLLALFGWAIAGFVWTVLWYVLVGIVIGGVARVLVRGTGRYGMGMTIIAGIAGSLLGGLLANVLDTGWFVQFLFAVLAAARLYRTTYAPQTHRGEVQGRTTKYALNGSCSSTCTSTDEKPASARSC